MAQIQKGWTFADGDLVTANKLNQILDSAILNPESITDQGALSTTLTGSENICIYDPVSSSLKKITVDSLSGWGGDIVTDSISGKTINGTLLIQGNGTSSHLVINSNATATGTIDVSAKNVNISAASSVDNTGALHLTAGTDGMTITSAGLITILNSVKFNFTSAIDIPVGTTAQRPSSPSVGSFRYNSTLSSTETYNGTDWSSTAIKVAVLTRELTHGTTQTFPANSWESIAYNKIVQSAPFIVNSASFTGTPSSSGSSVITLPAGTYSIDAEASIQGGGGAGSCVARILNNTSASVISTGITTYCAGYSHGTSIVYGTFTLTTQSDIIVQFYANASGTPTTFGSTVPSAPEVIYTAKITKIA